MEEACKNLELGVHQSLAFTEFPRAANLSWEMFESARNWLVSLENTKKIS